MAWLKSTLYSGRAKVNPGHDIAEFYCFLCNISIYEGTLLSKEGAVGEAVEMLNRMRGSCWAR